MQWCFLLKGVLPDDSQPEEEDDAVHADFKQLPTSRKEDRLFLIVCVLWVAFVLTVQLMRTGPCAALLSSVWSHLFATTIKRD